MSAVESNKVVARKLVEALGKLDGAALVSIMDPDFVLETKGTSAISGVRTLAQLPEVVQIMSVAVPNGVNLEIVSTTAEEDRVVCEVKGSGIAASGKAYRNEYAFILRFKNGKVSRMAEYMDTKLVDDLFGPMFRESVGSSKS